MTLSATRQVVEGRMYPSPASRDWDFRKGETSQNKNFRTDVSFLDSQSSHTHRQFEPSRSRASGIEVEHSVLDLLLRLVGMAADHSREPRGLGIEVERV